MRYKLTTKINDEIKKSIGDKRGAAASFCRLTNLSQQLVSAIMRGKHPVVQEDTWLRLCRAIPALSAMAEPQESVNGSRQSPIAIATTSGANSPATATVGDCSRDCAACRARLRQKVLSSGMDPSAMVAFLKMIEEAK